MQQHVALLMIVVVAAGLSSAQTVPDQKKECTANSDCGLFSYCQLSPFTGHSCLSNNNAEKAGASCEGKGPDGEKFENHNECHQGKEDSVQRCFKELGYKCASAFYMPCTPNNDEHGKPHQGQEESCPTKFACVSQEFTVEGKKESHKVCLPDETAGVKSHPAEPNSACKTSFDCGWSQLQNAWTQCHHDTCIVVEE